MARRSPRVGRTGTTSGRCLNRGSRTGERRERRAGGTAGGRGRGWRRGGSGVGGGGTAGGGSFCWQEVGVTARRGRGKMHGRRARPGRSCTLPLVQRQTAPAAQLPARLCANCRATGGKLHELASPVACVCRLPRAPSAPFPHQPPRLPHPPFPVSPSRALTHSVTTSYSCVPALPLAPRNSELQRPNGALQAARGRGRPRTGKKANSAKEQKWSQCAPG
jgi:hypothetical protein